MIAIYSYWDTTGDLTKSAGNWSNPKFMLYSLVHSVKKSKEHFGYAKMITTSSCKEIFESLEIFDEVTTELDNIAHYPKSLWALGKIYAYSIQTEPFIHLDNDVQLEKPINDNLLKKDVVVQSVEDDWRFTSFYQWMITEHLFKGGFKTEVEKFNEIKSAYNMAIYLCNDLKFNKEYCDEAFKMVDENVELFTELHKKYCLSIIFEQYLINLLALKNQVNVGWLMYHADNSKNKDIGYRHIWGAKRNENWYNWFKKVIEMSYPKQYEIINNLIK